MTYLVSAFDGKSVEPNDDMFDYVAIIQPEDDEMPPTQFGDFCTAETLVFLNLHRYNFIQIQKVAEPEDATESEQQSS